MFPTTIHEKHILIVDDDVELTELIKAFLTKNEFRVSVEHDGRNIDDYVSMQCPPDLIVLDLMLPGIDGLTLCKHIRDRYHGPIIMLTALDDDIDEVTGLEVGADDYLAKPVKPRILLAHIRAHLRIFSRIELLEPIEDEQVVVSHELVIDKGKREVTHHGKRVELASSEFDLLWILAQNIGEVISRERLHQQIFRLPFDGIDRSIDLRISRLRKKLNDDPKMPDLIKTVRNAGYLLVK